MDAEFAASVNKYLVYTELTAVGSKPCVRIECSCVYVCVSARAYRVACAVLPSQYNQVSGHFSLHSCGVVIVSQPYNQFLRPSHSGLSYYHQMKHLILVAIKFFLCLAMLYYFCVVSAK